jgi:hypothetical protein
MWLVISYTALIFLPELSHLLDTMPTWESEIEYVEGKDDLWSLEDLGSNPCVAI